MKKLAFIVVFSSLFACHFNRKDKAIGEIIDLPSFKLLLTDSTTVVNTKDIHTGKPIILMYFSPDCEHCQEQTKNILKNMSELKDTQIFLLSPASLSEIKAFYSSFHLASYKNIFVGRDFEYAFYPLYKSPNFPCTAIYDSKKKLVKLFKTEIDISQIIEASHI